MGWYSMLREHMEQKELCQLGGSDGIVSGDEYSLLGETIHYNQYGSMGSGSMDIEFHSLSGTGNCFNIHTIQSVSQSLSLCASSTGFDIVFDEGMDIWPGIFTTDKLNCAVLSEVTSQRVVMFIPEYS
ncbi:hypothetical protein PISMIDRAFT_113329 [Pisolithus microcarpus 441]|uniref:Uncharacterized protein n=1 Tax=Pisolithus microcarpus 441 TaxID=765257 RepID=A0A0C9YIE2_9AGAM|nr:hypothetical protein PISMIDRAFT_113329 [Pisolithus microcarpus 441]